MTGRRSGTRWLAAVLSLLISLAASAPSPAQISVAELPEMVTELIDGEEFSNAFWGIQIADLETGEILFDRNGTKSFMPASNMKLYTSSAALHYLGPDWQFQTDVFVDGPVENGVLNGNLIVRGSGDPTIGGRFNDGDLTLTFRNWADSLRALGITRIDGDVIGDGSIFDDVPLGRGWSWEYLTEWYAAESGGLVFNDNCVDFEMAGERVGTPARITWEPFETDYVQVLNASVTVHPDSGLSRNYYRRPATNHITIESRIPEGSTDRRSLTVTNSSLYFAHVLRETLVRAGIPVSGEPRDVRETSILPNYEDAAVHRVAVHYSPPLSEIVKVINKPSQNLYAEQVLRAIGAFAENRTWSPAGASISDGAELARDFFGAVALDTTILMIADGSGLSRMNLITPEMTVRLLQRMARDGDPATREAFFESLPIGGVDGTLEFRFRRGPSFNNVRAKTGFIGYVRGLSGYVTSQSGRRLVFSLLCNHYTIPTSRVNEVQDGIVNLLAVIRD